MGPDPLALLGPNYPNPFNPSTAIPFAIERATRVRLEIYNALGQRVRLLTDEFRAPGAHTILWDGRDEQGRASAAGVYFYRLAAGGQIASGRMVLVDGSIARAGRSPAPRVQTEPNIYAATLSGPTIATRVLPRIVADGYPLTLIVSDRTAVPRAVASTIAVDAAPNETSPDFDGNGEVDFGDFFLLIEAFGKESRDEGFDVSLDLVPDGKITLEDFFRFADHFGQ